MSRQAWTPTPEQLILLRRNLTDYFRDGELRALCTELGIEYGRLHGQSRAARAGDLIRRLTARRQLAALVALAVRRRPEIAWGDLPTDLAPPPHPAETRGPSGRWVILKRVGWLAVGLIAVGGLAVLLSGGLRRTSPGLVATLVPGTPPPAPNATMQVFTPVPPTVGVTATPHWTPVPPSMTALPLPAALGTTAPTQSAAALSTATSLPKPLPTPTPTAQAQIRAPRTVTLLAPVNGVCDKSTAVTFKWAGTFLGPGEAFLVVIVPSQVRKGNCTGNFANEGIQISPPVPGNEWTADLSTPPHSLIACAGIVEWTVYISNPAGNIQAAPWQYFEWNPLRCR